MPLLAEEQTPSAESDVSRAQSILDRYPGVAPATRKQILESIRTGNVLGPLKDTIRTSGLSDADARQVWAIGTAKFRPSPPEAKLPDSHDFDPVSTPSVSAAQKPKIAAVAPAQLPPMPGEVLGPPAPAPPAVTPKSQPQHTAADAYRIPRLPDSHDFDPLTSQAPPMAQSQLPPMPGSGAGPRLTLNIGERPSRQAVIDLAKAKSAKPPSDAALNEMRRMKDLGYDDATIMARLKGLDTSIDMDDVARQNVEKSLEQTAHVKTPRELMDTPILPEESHSYRDDPVQKGLYNFARGMSTPGALLGLMGASEFLGAIPAGIRLAVDAGFVYDMGGSALEQYREIQKAKSQQDAARASGDMQTAMELENQISSAWGQLVPSLGMAGMAGISATAGVHSILSRNMAEGRVAAIKGLKDAIAESLLAQHGREGSKKMASDLVDRAFAEAEKSPSNTQLRNAARTIEERNRFDAARPVGEGTAGTGSTAVVPVPPATQPTPKPGSPIAPPPPPLKNPSRIFQVAGDPIVGVFQDNAVLESGRLMPMARRPLYLRTLQEYGVPTMTDAEIKALQAQKQPPLPPVQVMTPPKPTEGAVRPQGPSERYPDAPVALPPTPTEPSVTKGTSDLLNLVGQDGPYERRAKAAKIFSWVLEPGHQRMDSGVLQAQFGIDAEEADAIIAKLKEPVPVEIGQQIYWKTMFGERRNGTVEGIADGYVKVRTPNGVVHLTPSAVNRPYIPGITMLSLPKSEAMTPASDEAMPQVQQETVPQQAQAPASLIDLRLNFPLSPHTQDRMVAASNDADIAAIARHLGVTGIVVDAPHTFELSQEGGIDAEGRVRLNPSAADPAETMMHEFGHLAWEAMTPEQRTEATSLIESSIDKIAPGYARMHREGTSDEAFSDLLGMKDSDAMRIALSVKKGEPRQPKTELPKEPDLLPWEVRSWDDVATKGYGAIRSTDDLVGMVDKYGERMIVIKDVNGGRHRMPASLAAKLLANPLFTGHLREVFLPVSGSESIGEPQFDFTLNHLPLMKKAVDEALALEGPKATALIAPKARTPKSAEWFQTDDHIHEKTEDGYKLAVAKISVPIGDGWMWVVYGPQGFPVAVGNQSNGKYASTRLEAEQLAEAAWKKAASEATQATLPPTPEVESDQPAPPKISVASDGEVEIEVQLMDKDLARRRAVAALKGSGKNPDDYEIGAVITTGKIVPTRGGWVPASAYPKFTFTFKPIKAPDAPASDKPRAYSVRERTDGRFEVIKPNGKVAPGAPFATREAAETEVADRQGKLDAANPNAVPPPIDFGATKNFNKDVVDKLTKTGELDAILGIKPKKGAARTGPLPDRSSKLPNVPKAPELPPKPQMQPVSASDASRDVLAKGLSAEEEANIQIDFAGKSPRGWDKADTSSLGDFGKVPLPDRPYVVKQTANGPRVWADAEGIVVIAEIAKADPDTVKAVTMRDIKPDFPKQLEEASAKALAVGDTATVELLDGLRDVVVDTLAAGRTSVTIVPRNSDAAKIGGRQFDRLGLGITAAKGFARHEMIHQTLGEMLSRANYVELDKVPAVRSVYPALAKKAKTYAKAVAGSSAGNIRTRVEEVFTHLLSGQAGVLGLSDDQAVDILDAAFGRLIELVGEQKVRSVLKVGAPKISTQIKPGGINERRQTVGDDRHARTVGDGIPGSRGGRTGGVESLPRQPETFTGEFSASDSPETTGDRRLSELTPENELGIVKLGSNFYRQTESYGAWADLMVGRIGSKVVPYLKSAYSFIEDIAETYGMPVHAAQEEASGGLHAGDTGDVRGATPKGKLPAADGTSDGDGKVRGEGEVDGKDGVKGVLGGGEDSATGRSGGIEGRDPVPDTSGKRSPRRGELANGGFYRIGPKDNLGAGTPAQKLKDNIAALQVLKSLETEGRLPTEAEKGVLVRYVGWGALAQTVFSGRYEHRADVEKIRSILSESEYEAARASTKNAHYTSPEVVNFMWGLAQRMGFKGGTILEPSMGTGNFLGLAPDSILPDSNFVGVELDTTTGKIGQYLYPGAQIMIRGYEKVMIPDGSVDLAISNVPFGNYGLSDSRYRSIKPLIHDYFFIKSLDKVRPGGLVMFITSRGTMDKLSAKVRNIMASRGDLVAAYRLPNTAFAKNAGTEVTTDIIILQKRAPQSPRGGESFADTVTVSPGITINEYFQRHPENMFGTMTLEGKMYHGGGNEPTLSPSGEPLEAQMARALVKAPKNVISSYQSAPPVIADAADAGIRELAYTVKDGQLLQRVDGVLVQPLDPKLATEPFLTQMKAMVGIRDLVQSLITLQRSTDDDAMLRGPQEELTQAYDAYVKEHDYLNSRGAKIFRDDPQFPLLLSLETINPETKKVSGKADIFTKRTIPASKPLTEVSADTGEALSQVLAERGFPDIDLLASLSNRPVEDVAAELLGDGKIFTDPATGKYETSERYLSGRVRDKLAVAREAAAQDNIFAPNVEALEKVQPKDRAPASIPYALGEAWIPKEAYAQFIAERLASSARSDFISVKRTQNGTWEVAFPTTQAEELQWGVHPIEARPGVPAGPNGPAIPPIEAAPGLRLQKLLELGMNLKRPLMKTYGTEDDPPRVHQVATLIARQRLLRLKDEFQTWARSSPQWSGPLATTFNHTFNATVLPKYDGSHLHLPGYSAAAKTPYPHQKDFAWRVINERKGLAAHEVGVGKTLAAILSTMELKRLGIAKKPMVVVPDGRVTQWARDFQESYPGANVLAIGPADLAGDKRRLMSARIATGTWDAVVMQHSSFKLVPISEQYVAASIREDINALMEALASTEGGQQSQGRRSRPRSVRQIETAIANLQQKLQDLLDKPKDNTIKFDELGVDFLIVDEAHAFKSLITPTKLGNVSGLGSKKGSGRALDMKTKINFIRENRSDDGGVVFLTGTPITNSSVEAYTMTRYVSPQTLKDAAINSFDDWAAHFGSVVDIKAMSHDARTFRLKTVFKLNTETAPELSAMFQEFADLQYADELGIKRPDIRGGRPEAVVIPANRVVQPLLDDIVHRIDHLRQNPASQFQPGGDNHLLLNTLGRLVALEPRLINPSIEDHPDSKTNTAVARINDAWKKNVDTKAVQLVFSQTYKLEDTATKKVLFHLYKDMKSKLVKMGIPSDQIAFAADYSGDKIQDLADAMNAGEIRVVFGTTEKIGVGGNMQERLLVLHNLDPTFRPDQLQQRIGRIRRQGNKNATVDILNYGLEGSLDAYLYQMMEQKEGEVRKVLRGEIIAGEDPFGQFVFQLSEMKALITGNKDMIRKMDIEGELAIVEALRRDKLSRGSNLRSESQRQQGLINSYREQAAMVDESIAMNTAYKEKVGKEGFEAEMNGQSFDSRDSLVAFIDANQALAYSGPATLYGVPIRFNALKAWNVTYGDETAKGDTPIAAANKISSLPRAGLRSALEKMSVSMALGEVSGRQEIATATQGVRGAVYLEETASYRYKIANEWHDVPVEASRFLAGVVNVTNNTLPHERSTLLLATSKAKTEVEEIQKQLDHIDDNDERDKFKLLSLQSELEEIERRLSPDQAARHDEDIIPDSPDAAEADDDEEDDDGAFKMDSDETDLPEEITPDAVTAKDEPAVEIAGPPEPLRASRPDERGSFSLKPAPKTPEQTAVDELKAIDNADPVTAQALQASAAKDKPGIMERIGASVERVKNDLFWENRTAEFPQFQEWLARVIDIVPNAMKAATAQVDQILGPEVTRAQAELARQTIVLEDIIETGIRLGEQTLPNSALGATLQNYEDRLQAVIDRSTPEVKAIVDRFHAVMDAAFDELVTRGKLGKKDKKRKYFPNIVLDYLNKLDHDEFIKTVSGQIGTPNGLQGADFSLGLEEKTPPTMQAGTPSRLKEPFRGYTVKRKGHGELFHSADAWDVTWRYLTKLGIDNHVSDLIDDAVQRFRNTTLVPETGMMRKLTPDEMKEILSKTDGRVVADESYRGPDGEMYYGFQIKPGQSLYRRIIDDVIVDAGLRKNPAVLMPMKIAQRLIAFRTRPDQAFLTDMATRATSLWKGIPLTHAGLSYHANNMAGDTLMALTIEPTAFLRLYPAAKLLYKDRIQMADSLIGKLDRAIRAKMGVSQLALTKDEQSMIDMMEAAKLMHASATSFFEQSGGHLTPKDSPTYRRTMEPGFDKAVTVVKKALGTLWNHMGLRTIGEYREALPRVAVWMAMNDLLEKNRAEFRTKFEAEYRKSHGGKAPSQKAMAKAEAGQDFLRFWQKRHGLTDQQIRDAIPRDDMVNYAKLNPRFRTWIRGLLFPFATFNLKIVSSMLRHAKNPWLWGIQGGLLLAAWLWNNTYYPDDETDAPEWMKYKLHFWTDGDEIDPKTGRRTRKALVFSFLPANVAGTWFGLDKWSSYLGDIYRKDADAKEIAGNIIGDWTGHNPVTGKGKYAADSAPAKTAYALLNPVISAVWDIHGNSRGGDEGRTVIPNRLKGTPKGDALQYEYLIQRIFSPVLQGFTAYEKAMEGVEEDEETSAFLPGGAMSMMKSYLFDRGPLDVWKALGIYDIDVQRERQRNWRDEITAQEAILASTIIDIQDAFIREQSTNNKDVAEEARQERERLQSGGEGPYVPADTIARLLNSPQTAIRIAQRKYQFEKDPKEKERLSDQIRSLDNTILSETAKRSPKAVRPNMKPVPFVPAPGRATATLPPMPQ